MLKDIDTFVFVDTPVNEGQVSVRDAAYLQYGIIVRPENDQRERDNLLI